MLLNYNIYNFLPSVSSIIFVYNSIYLILDFIYSSSDFFSLSLNCNLFFFLFLLTLLSSTLTSNTSSKFFPVAAFVIGILLFIAPYFYLMDTIYSLCQLDYFKKIFFSLCFYFCMVPFLTF